MTPIISIIIPCYNSQKYLDACLDSVVKQTYSHWEAICVNDGSTDTTGDILDVFAQKDKRIKVIHQKNGGVSEARNNALMHCSGDYICFVDSDDMVAENYLEYLVQMLSDTADLAICGFSRNLVNDSSNVKKEVERMECQSFVRRMITDKGFHPQLWCMLFRTSLVKEQKLYFWKGCARGEDREFFMKYLINCREICYAAIPIYYYRVNDSSAMASLNEKSLTSIEAAYRTMCFYQQRHHPATEWVSMFFDYTIWKYMILSMLEHKSHLFAILENKYNLKEVTKQLRMYPNRWVRISSAIYQISCPFFKRIFWVLGYLYKKA